MAKKRKQQKPQHARIKKSRVHTYVIGTLVVTLLTLVLILGKTLIHPDTFLIQRIEVQGQHPHVEQAKLRAILRPYLHMNFFSIDLGELREHLLDFPWVAEVKITRVLPNKLMLHIQEEKPVAVWNNKDLMNVEGEVFTPSRATFPTNLPALYGEPGQQLVALETYGKLSEMLKPWHLAPVTLILTAQQSWVLVLTNGMQVKLGNDNIYAHFRQFLQVYNNLFLNKESKVEYIDISYPHGMAVKWKT